MIFQHTWQWLLEPSPHTGKLKTQTRRRVKPGQELFAGDFDPDAVMQKGQSSYREVFAVGKTYAVQPGRGQKSVGRIRILSIRHEDVREISLDDVQAEGFRGWHAFIETWIKMHDPELAKTDWNEEIVRQRPAHRYDAWVLEFEVAR